MELIRDPAVIAGYLRDASNTLGHAEALVRPRSTAEVSEVLAHCQTHGVPLTITAQRTSTTGGPVPEGGWLLSTEHLDRILHLGPDSATAEGGVILGELQRAVAERGLLYPPDPTSQDDCSLGASIACNASGARSFRYGATRRWVRSLELVLPDGRVLEVDRTTPIPADWPRVAWREPAVKSAAGYHSGGGLLDLVIGSEGTLGLITRATVELVPAPEAVFSVMAFFPSTERGLDFVEATRAKLRPRLIEWYDAYSLALVRERVPELPAGARAAVWCEQDCSAEDLDEDLGRWAEHLEAFEPEEVLFADDERGLQRLRAIRHAVPAGVNERVARNGMPKVGTDFAVPDTALRELMAAYDAVPMDHVLFGHVGDNHLHLNLLPSSLSELEEAWAIWRRIYRLALDHGGTLSAEHGVGKLKRPYLPDMVGDAVIASFKALKAHLDPAWILGRGTLLEVPGALGAPSGDPS